MPISGKLAALLAVFLMSGAGTWAEAVVMEDTVAKVNGKPLLLSEYRNNVRNVLDTWQRTIPTLLKDQAAVNDIRRQVLEQMIDDELLVQEAERLKMKIYVRELDKGIEEVQERSFRTDEETGKRRSDAEMSAALASELRKQGITEEQFREHIRKQLLLRKLVEEQVRPKLKEGSDASARDTFGKLKSIVAEGTAAVKGLPEEEVQAYASFASRLRDTHSERVRVSHILVKTAPGASIIDKNKALERATALRKRIEAGEDFSDVAQKESDDAESAPRGGDLGFILRGWMPPEFEKMAFSLGVGDLSQPVGTNFGYHLIRVQEKKAKENLNFDKLKIEIKQFLMDLDLRRELQLLVKKLRADSTIEKKLPAD